jgi:flagellar biosynthesis component FlhA
LPFAFIIVGTVLLISGVKGTSQDLLTLVKGDLTGTNNYLYWVIAILIVGSIGYIPGFKKFSVAFLSLVLLVLFIREGNPQGSGGGFFQEFQTAIQKISNSNSNPLAGAIQIPVADGTVIPQTQTF